MRAARIEVVVSDFGGVLTSPLVESFMAFQDQTGITTEALGKAMAATAEANGENPLFEMERGEITEVAFLEQLTAALEPLLGHVPEMHRFKEIYFEALQPNPPMIDLMRELKEAGLPDGDADQQRPGVGAAVAPDAARGRDLRDGCRLRLRRLPQAGIADLRADPRANRGPRRVLPLRRRRRGQHRGRPQGGHERRPLPRQRAGDRRDPRRARRGAPAASCPSRRDPRHRARRPRPRAPSGAAARAARGRARARLPR